jgi:hypothetical protein
VHQLSFHSSSFRSALVATNQVGVPNDPDEHITELLVRVWKECRRRRDSKLPSFFIVIDALDELENDEGSTFLRQLLRVIQDGELTGLRVLITSRPDPDIVALCESLPADAVHVCRLQDASTPELEGDIRTFLDAKLPALQSSTELQQLARRSRGLFIYAATAVRYITPRAKMTLEEQFALLDKFLGTGRGSHNTLLLNELYKQILWSAFSGLDGDLFSCRLRILHAILAIPSVQHPETIAQLDAMFTVKLVELVVTELNAVLYLGLDRKICWYHASFPDFIFDPTRSKFTVKGAEGMVLPVDMSCSKDARLAFMESMVKDVFLENRNLLIRALLQG